MGSLGRGTGFGRSVRSGLLAGTEWREWGCFLCSNVVSSRVGLGPGTCHQGEAEEGCQSFRPPSTTVRTGPRSCATTRTGLRIRSGFNNRPEACTSTHPSVTRRIWCPVLFQRREPLADCFRSFDEASDCLGPLGVESSPPPINESSSSSTSTSKFPRSSVSPASRAQSSSSRWSPQICQANRRCSSLKEVTKAWGDSESPARARNRVQFVLLRGVGFAVSEIGPYCPNHPTAMDRASSGLPYHPND